MGPQYPELRTDRARIRDGVRGRGALVPADAAERARLFDQWIAEHGPGPDMTVEVTKASGRHEEYATGPSVPGDVAFKLHDTYGFPIDLTLEMAAEQGLTVDDRRLPRPDAGAARARQGRRQEPQGRARRTWPRTGDASTTSARPSSPATTRSPARAACAGCCVDGEPVRSAAGGQRRRGRARPHAVLRRGRRPARRRGRHPAGQRRGARGARRAERRCAGWSCTGPGSSTAR